MNQELFREFLNQGSKFARDVLEPFKIDSLSLIPDIQITKLEDLQFGQLGFSIAQSDAILTEILAGKSAKNYSFFVYLEWLGIDDYHFHSDGGNAFSVDDGVVYVPANNFQQNICKEARYFGICPRWIFAIDMPYDAVIDALNHNKFADEFRNSIRFFASSIFDDQGWVFADIIL